MHEFSVKQYATASSRTSLKILILWDVTMLIRTSIYDVAGDHRQYENTKRRNYYPNDTASLSILC